MISAETVREILKLRSYLREQSYLKERLATGTATEKPPTLYHYTDAAGLMGIVDSGALWATHYAYLNDASEFRYAAGVMKEVVTEATADAKPDSWKARFLRVMSQDDNPSVYNADSRDADEQQFVACFCEGGDGLSQWRGYGKSIGGYSLGFKFADLQAVEKRINASQEGKTINQASPHIRAEFLPCWYSRKEQKALIADGFERALRHCETTRYPVDDSSLAALLRAILRSVSSCFKDPAFRDEHEWRLVVRVWRPDSGSFGEERERTQEDMRMDQVANVRFRRGEFSLVPYVVVPVVFNAPLSLSEVFVGPTPLRENARAAAMQLLLAERHGSGTPAVAQRRIVCAEITNSSIPFRRV